MAASLPALAIDLATTTTPNTPVQAIAYDGISNRLYFLERTGALKRVELNPFCEEGSPACVVTTVVTFPDTPFAVAVNAPAGFAYVTTRGSGTLTGTLWRVDLNSQPPTRSMVVPNLTGLPTHLALAPDINAAYVLDTRGKIWRVDLASGQQTGAAPAGPGTQGLGTGPQGLVVNAAHTLAYLSYPSPNRILEIDLGTGTTRRTLGSFGQAGASSLAWTDSAETALYFELTEDFAQRSTLLQVDLATSTSTLVSRFNNQVPSTDPRAVPSVSTGLAVNPLGGGVYLGLGRQVVRHPLGLVANQTKVFIAVGSILAQPPDIGADGYTNPASGRFKDAPFGGTLDIRGDLLWLHKLNADRYQIWVSRNGIAGPFVQVLASWTTSHWNPNAKPLPNYETVLVAPDAAGFYSIHPDYHTPKTVPYWRPEFLMLRWPTSENGLYTLAIRIFNGMTDITTKIPPNLRTLTLRVDNTPPVAVLDSIGVLDAAQKRTVVLPCNIVTSPSPGTFNFGLQASDPNGHLEGYELFAEWGRNQRTRVLGDSYAAHANPNPGHSWSGLNANGVFSTLLPAAPGWSATCDCAHMFRLDVRKRSTDGYNYVYTSSSSLSVTINNVGRTCP